MLNNVTEEMDRSASQEQSAPRDVRFRLNCFLLWESAFVEFAEMGFRECWFAAVASYASSNIALRNSVIEGSTWAFLAVGKKGRPETAHSSRSRGTSGVRALRLTDTASPLARFKGTGVVP
jgi:hypothetical protein